MVSSMRTAVQMEWVLGERRPVALVTGSSSGIGLETCLKLAHLHGYKVYASMRDPDRAALRLEPRARALGLEVGRHLVVVRLDVDDAQGARAAVEAILAAEDGCIDVLVNNAGIHIGGVFELIPPEDVEAVFRTNVLGLMYVTQAVLPAMKRRRSGVIVNVSAVGGVNGSAFSEVFCATKFAVEGFTEAIAQAAMHFNIRVCVVEPGPTYWEGMPALKVAGSSGAADPETQELWRRFNSGGDAGRGPVEDMVKTAEQVAAAIVDAIQRQDAPFRIQTHPFYQRDIEDKLRDPCGWGKVRELSERYCGSLG